MDRQPPRDEPVLLFRIMNKKRVKIDLNAPAVRGFSAICLAVTALGIMSGGRITWRYFMTYRSSLLDPMTYFRAFSYVFGHSGWDHFFGNVSYILLLGPMLEEKYGSRRIVQVIAATALVTSVVNAVFFPGSGISGASGVVFAFILLTSFTEFRAGEIPITFLLVAGIYIGKELVAALTVIDSVSQLGHILGGITGAVIGYSLNRKGR